MICPAAFVVETVPYVPLSQPFVERLIGTVRRKFLDRTPFWNARDLERKLDAFKAYYNGPAYIGRLADKRRLAYRVRGNHSDDFGGKGIVAGSSRCRFRRE